MKQEINHQKQKRRHQTLVYQNTLFKNNSKKKAARLGESLYEGNIAVNPYEYKTRTSCDWCPYQAVCGFEKGLSGYQKRRLTELKPDTFWQVLEKYEEEEGKEE